MQTLRDVIASFEKKMLSNDNVTFDRYDDYISKYILKSVLEQLKETINKLSDAAIKYILYQSEYHKMLFYDILKTLTSEDNSFSFVSFVDYIMFINYNINSNIDAETGLLLLKNAVNTKNKTYEVA